MPARNAGTSITVTCASARSQDASATRLTLTHGNGLADFIPAVFRASARATPPKRSTRPAPTSKRHGQCFYRSEPRPTFRNGAVSGIGRLRNIAASIEVSACRRTGSRRAPRGADETTARLDAAIRRSHSPAPRSPARHLKNAAEHIQKLPKAEQDLEEWQAAVEALLLVVELSGPTMMARIGFMRALNLNVERVFGPSRKDTRWGRRQLKRDE